MRCRCACAHCYAAAASESCRRSAGLRGRCLPVVTVPEAHRERDLLEALATDAQRGVCSDPECGQCELGQEGAVPFTYEAFAKYGVGTYGKSHRAIMPPGTGCGKVPNCVYSSNSSKRRVAGWGWGSADVCAAQPTHARMLCTCVGNAAPRSNSAVRCGAARIGSGRPDRLLPARPAHCRCCAQRHLRPRRRI